MQKKVFISSILMLFAIVGYAQNGNQTDSLFLKNGDRLSIILNVQESNEQKISFQYGMGGKKQGIAIKRVDTVLLSDGSIFYPKKQPLAVIKPPKALEPPIDTARALALKTQITNDASAMLGEMYKKIDEERTREFYNASAKNNAAVSAKVYDLIKDDFDDLKCSDTKYEGDILINVDTSGNVVSVNHSADDSRLLTLTESAFNSKVFPKIQTQNLNVNSKSFNNENAYDQLYSRHKKSMQDIDDSGKYFERHLEVMKELFRPTNNVTLGVNTSYAIPINLAFSKSRTRWKVKSGKITEASTNQPITDKNLLSSFQEVRNKKKYGIYSIDGCTYKVLNEPLGGHVEKAELKYKYYTYTGTTAMVLFDLSRGDFKTEVNQFVLYNGFSIYHRFGVFGGAAIYNSSFIENKQLTGTYVGENGKYFEAGIYLGLAQYIYLKMGYTSLKSELVEYNQSIVLNTLGERQYHGFITGLSFMFPYFHVEGGYNHSFKSIYTGAGLNIPINR